MQFKSLCSRTEGTYGDNKTVLIRSFWEIIILQEESILIPPPRGSQSEIHNPKGFQQFY